MSRRIRPVFSRCYRALMAVSIGSAVAVPDLSAQLTPKELARSTRDSLVTVTHYDRDGKMHGAGSGFVVGADGLIATSLHVIGEARPIKIRFANGDTYDVQSIEAWNRTLDLAVVRIGATDLEPLPIGDSDGLEKGQGVIAIGNPMGLEMSIVQGIVSGVRSFDHGPMIQLAIPIEPGNSGGPLLDLKGHVCGLLNMKSLVTDNLGFATPVNALKLILEKPNPVSMERWLRIGALDPRQWKVVFGGIWNQKTDRVKVTGQGKSFGGRALCLSTQPAPQPPFEVEVNVQLGSETGAAGLVFCADGGDRHYGFYPSGGQIRFTRFDGPSVYSWTILNQIQTPHYRRGDWNSLKIRFEKKRILGFVNGRQILESQDRGLREGQVGFAKFRDTVAEFKGFQLRSGALASEVDGISEIISSEIGAPVAFNPSQSEDTLQSLLANPTVSQDLLNARARELDEQAKQLRELATRLHRRSVASELLEELDRPEAEIDLFHAALLVAKHDDRDVDVTAYRRQLDDLADEVRGLIGEDYDSSQKLGLLIDFLFHQNGFHGSHTDYYNRSNSYMNDVIDDREGLPITLSVLFMELARKVEIPDVVGLPLPGHFMVKVIASGGRPQVIDVFNGGKIMTHAEADDFASRFTNRRIRSDRMEPASKRQIIVRMLNNLRGWAARDESIQMSLPYSDLMVQLNPEDPFVRLERAWGRMRTGDIQGARIDFKWILDNAPPGFDLDRVAQTYESLAGALPSR